VTVIGLVIGLVQAGTSGPEFLKTLGSSALSLLTGLMTAFGNIVLVFAILERTLPKTDFAKELEDWDPSELASEPDPDRVKFGEQIFETIFAVLVLVILNLYPNVIGFGFLDKGEWVFIAPVLTKAFFSYLPWINILMRHRFNIYLRVGSECSVRRRCRSPCDRHAEDALARQRNNCRYPSAAAISSKGAISFIMVWASDYVSARRVQGVLRL
jgi:hypothetical protein